MLLLIGVKLSWHAEVGVCVWVICDTHTRTHLWICARKDALFAWSQCKLNTNKQINRVVTSTITTICAPPRPSSTTNSTRRRKTRGVLVSFVCFNTLQHTATHCNTLQHTATHCNTLQHTATQRYWAISYVWYDSFTRAIRIIYTWNSYNIQPRILLKKRKSRGFWLVLYSVWDECVVSCTIMYHVTCSIICQWRVTWYVTYGSWVLCVVTDTKFAWHDSYRYVCHDVWQKFVGLVCGPTHFRIPNTADTAAHCNALQHAASCCNTWQHTATRIHTPAIITDMLSTRF